MFSNERLTRFLQRQAVPQEQPALPDANLFKNNLIQRLREKLQRPSKQLHATTLPLENNILLENSLLPDTLLDRLKLSDGIQNKLPEVIKQRFQIQSPVILDDFDDPNDLNRHLPQSLHSRFKMSTVTSKVSDIRFTVNQPVSYVLTNGTILFVDKDFNITDSSNNCEKVIPSDIASIVNHLSANALYAYKSDLINGFITLPHGHRVGISGVVNSAQEYKYVLSLNFRIFRDIKGTAKNYMQQILDASSSGVGNQSKMSHYDSTFISSKQRSRVNNTLIISPPARGKTTLLRDIARNLSYASHRVAIIDTRGELTAHYGGNLQVDLGPLATVSVGGDKHLEIIKSVRSMSPEVIITDEIGTAEDIKALKYCLTSGVNIVCSIHGQSRQDAENRLGMPINQLFKEIIIL